MKQLKLKYFLIGFGIVAIILTLTPFIAVDYWWIRMFDFPHLQLTGLTALAILVYIIRFDFKNWRDYTFMSLLIACCLFQFVKIYPYTALADYEVANSTNKSPSISIYTANVLQKNKEYNHVRAQIKEYKADLILLTETDKVWMNQVKSNLNADYSEQVEVPLDNTYGMLMYSKLPLFDTEIKYLVSDSIPSIHTKIRLNSGEIVQLYAIHPTPPMPQENPLSTDRDAELMMIAKLARESEYPVIVIGDFNDVAWSETSKLFQSVSELLDVRKGRGLFNTYNAKSFLMRWPLDHIFISSDFRLVDIQKCETVNSDHFPLYNALRLEPELKASQEPPKPSKDQLEKAQNQIDNFLEEKKVK